MKFYCKTNANPLIKTFIPLQKKRRIPQKFIMLKPTIFPTIVLVLFQVNIHQLEENPARDSDLSTYFFGQLNGVACILLGVVVYIRYRQIKQLIEQHPDSLESSAKFNQNALHLGYCLSVGCAFALNLQYMRMPIVNYCSALCCFCLCIGYFWLQNHLTKAIQPYCGSQDVTRSRFVITILCIVFVATFAIGKLIRFILVMGNSLQWWLSNDLWHIVSNKLETISSIAAWLAAMISAMYIMTFKQEFKAISFEQPAISITGEKQNEHPKTERA